MDPSQNGQERPPRSSLGWTQVPNELLEKLPLTELSPLQFKILLVLYRYSIGFNRQHCDRLTLRGVARKVGREWSDHFRQTFYALEQWNMVQVFRSEQRGARAILVPETDPRRWRLPKERGGENFPTFGSDPGGEEFAKFLDEFLGKRGVVLPGRSGVAKSPRQRKEKDKRKTPDGRVIRFANERAQARQPVKTQQRRRSEAARR